MNGLNYRVNILCRVDIMSLNHAILYNKVSSSMCAHAQVYAYELRLYMYAYVCVSDKHIQRTIIFQQFNIAATKPIS